MTDNTLRMFVGTYTEPILFGTGSVLHGKGCGIYAYDIDIDSGDAVHAGTIESVRNPSYLTLSADSSVLFCVNELKSEDRRTGGAVSSYALAGGPGEARFIGSRPSRGADPCHLTLDRSGRFLLTANFMSGSISVHPVSNTGEIGSTSDFREHRGSGTDPVRQQGPHAHAVTVSADNRFVFVPDLGLDAIVVYEFDSLRGLLRDRPDLLVASRPGAGPRHIVFTPDDRFAYLINELNSTITAYRYDPPSGRLNTLQVLSTLPAVFRGHATGAHIDLSPCGRYLYASNRGHDSIVTFRIDQQSGELAVSGHVGSGGACPRCFAITPAGDLLAAANQDTDTIVFFSPDRETGLPTRIGHEVSIPTPVCVVFA